MLHRSVGIQHPADLQPVPKRGNRQNQYRCGAAGDGAVRIAAAIVLSKIDYHTMARMWKFHTAVCYGLLLLLFPFGVQRVEWVDDRNWLPIPFLGINFQPSELLKISFIITFAYHLSKVKDTLNRPKQLLLLFAARTAAGCHHPFAGR